jgi:hypothetical protein
MQDQASKYIVHERPCKQLAKIRDHRRRQPLTSLETPPQNPPCFLCLSVFVKRLFQSACAPHHSLRGHVPVKTNCPTVAENPDKKALNGCKIISNNTPMIRICTHVVPSNHAVNELKHSNHNQKAHKHINQFRSLTRSIQIVLPYS